MAGADEHDVARLDQHFLTFRGRPQFLCADGVAGGECVDVVEPGDVEQHAARHDRAELLDAELRGSGVVDDVVADAVVEQVVVAGVGQRVPVRRGLRSHLERVVTRREVAAISGERDVDVQHAPLRIDAAGNAAGLRPVGIERDGKGEGNAAVHCGGTSTHGVGGDEVQRPALVVRTPATPVRDAPGQRLEVFRERHACSVSEHAHARNPQNSGGRLSPHVDVTHFASCPRVGEPVGEITRGLVGSQVVEEVDRAHPGHIPFLLAVQVPYAVRKRPRLWMCSPLRPW